MPRFYFHIVSNSEVFLDDEGATLPDLAAAHHHAVQLIFRTMDYDQEEQNWHGWRILVGDAEGASLLTVLYPSRESVRPKLPLRASAGRIALV